jgi:putative Mg2+ transporter-C (MgtC) family protein
MYNLSEVDAMLRIALALIAGAFLGLEREFHEKPAGLRTYALVCEGAAIFMICSILLGHDVIEAGGANYDPSRIASTVVQGIGFLAAGVILATGVRVKHLTTAAEIWVTAAIGLLIGAGFYIVAVTATIGTVAFLTSFGWLKERMRPQKPDRDEETPGSGQK